MCLKPCSATAFPSFFLSDVWKLLQPWEERIIWIFSAQISGDFFVSSADSSLADHGQLQFHYTTPFWEGSTQVATGRLELHASFSSLIVSVLLKPCFLRLCWLTLCSAEYVARPHALGACSPNEQATCKGLAECCKKWWRVVTAEIGMIWLLGFNCSNHTPLTTCFFCRF